MQKMQARPRSRPAPSSSQYRAMQNSTRIAKLETEVKTHKVFLGIAIVVGGLHLLGWLLSMVGPKA